MKRIILSIALLFGIASCGGEPTIETTEQKVVASYRLGTHAQGTLATVQNSHPGFGSVTYSSFSIQMPNLPINPSSSSSFAVEYGIGYFGGNQQNSVFFKIERSGFGNYHIHIDGTTGDGTGGQGIEHNVAFPNLLTGTAYPGQTVGFVWASSYYGPAAYVALSTDTAYGHNGFYASRNWEFASNTDLPNYVYNPVFTYGVNTSVPTFGCAHDMPATGTDNQISQMGLTAAYGMPIGDGSTYNPYIFNGVGVSFPSSSGCGLDAYPTGSLPPGQYNSTITWSNHTGT